MFDSSDETHARLERARAAEVVRGRHHCDWIPEIKTMDDDEALPLLLEIILAAEESTKIAGWAMPRIYTHMAADIYERMGEKDKAIALCDRYLDQVRQFRKHEPEGGDKGVVEIEELRDQLSK
ncbi:hypothetical protein IEU95_03605 [Hoyosella rhizosphaerae]|uniref:Uncharacterized protein n=1 Tax=Hoyosella rhizosphaerae TaxID=1755582 RepID=A0A916UC15_9ACTN|nr:hypothetical protein [Hoyosella rhizosphaerae]MBN4925901.1 hypothetical protein [Hoyosella rhizosphaerae]GGC67075.1 hypothetical protein GCM10011410_19670 [Hoyosella rhizosphaerae]